MTDITQGTFATPTADVRDRYEHVNSSGEQVGNDLARGFGDAAQAYTKYKTDQQNALATAAVENGSQQILTGVAAYDKRLRQISESMMTADPQKAQQLQDEVQRIKDGEVQGVISPSAAILQYHNIAKNYGSNPLIASAARQYVGTFTGELGAITSSDNEQTATEKGHAALAERAASHLRSVPEQLAVEQQDENSKKAASDYVRDVQNGKAMSQDAMYNYIHAGDPSTPQGKLVAAFRPSLIAENINGYIKAVAAGAPKEKVLQMIELGKERTRDGFRTMLQAIHSDPKAAGFKGEGGIVFEEESIDKMLDSLTKDYDSVKDIVEKSDRLDMLKRQWDANVDIRIKQGDADALDHLGYIGFKAVNSTDPAKAMSDFATFLTDRDHGLIGMQNAIENADPGSTTMFRFLSGKEMIGDFSKSMGQILGSTHLGVPKVGQPRPDAASPPPAQAFADKKLFNIISSEPDVNKAIEWASNFLNSGRPLEGFVANLKTMGPLLQKSPPMQKLVENRYTAQVADVVRKLNASDLTTKFTYDTKRGQWVVDPTLRIDPPADVYGSFLANLSGGPTKEASQAYENSGIRQSGTQLAKYMNQMETIVASYHKNPAEAHAWIAKQFSDLVETKATAAENEAAAFKAAGINGTFHLMTDANGNQVLGQNGVAVDPNTPVGKKDAIAMAQAWEGNGQNEAALAIYNELNKGKNGPFSAKIKALTAKVEAEAGKS